MNVEMLLAVLGVVVLFLLPGVFIIGKACEQPKAKLRADQVLRTVLTSEQYGQLMQQRYIDIPSPSDSERVYRVPKLPGLVQVREKGSTTMWLCLQTLEWMPNADIVVIHKLMIEADEETYLQKANQLFPCSVDYNGRITLRCMDR